MLVSFVSSSTNVYLVVQLHGWLHAQLAIRAILCIADLDYECYQFLRSFNLPALASIAARKDDPCEVNLDSAESSEASESFEFFGLGPLQRHPLLANYFNQSLALRDCVCCETVMQYLLDYLGDLHTDSEKAQFTTDAFVQYLCTELSVSSLFEVGVCIRGELSAERLALQHTIQQRYKLFVEVTKKELAHFNQQISSLEGTVSSRQQSRKKRHKGEQTDIAPRKERECVNGGDATEVVTDATADQAATPAVVQSAVSGEGEWRLPVEAAADPLQIQGLAVAVAPEVLHVAPPSATKPTSAVYAPGSFETKMKIFAPDAMTSSRNAGEGTASSLTGGDIYYIENSELQGCLPAVPVGAEGLDSRAAGRWGEALVHQYLLSQRGAGSTVQWLNENEESRAAYDFIVTTPTGLQATLLRASHLHHRSSDPGSCSTSTMYSSWYADRGGPARTEYIEVKTTRFADRNVFEVSPFEWQFASVEPRVPYHVYRVFAAGLRQQVRILVVRDVYNRVLEGRVKLCLAT
jgi:hypothetical protein